MWVDSMCCSIKRLHYVDRVSPSKFSSSQIDPIKHRFGKKGAAYDIFIVNTIENRIVWFKIRWQSHVIDKLNNTSAVCYEPNNTWRFCLCYECINELLLLCGYNVRSFNRNPHDDTYFNCVLKDTNVQHISAAV